MTWNRLKMEMNNKQSSTRKPNNYLDFTHRILKRGSTVKFVLWSTNFSIVFMKMGDVLKVPNLNDKWCKNAKFHTLQVKVFSKSKSVQWCHSPNGLYIFVQRIYRSFLNSYDIQPQHLDLLTGTTNSCFAQTHLFLMFDDVTFEILLWKSIKIK